MNMNLKLDKAEYPVFSFSLSVFLHALIILIAAIILNSSVNETKIGSYVQIRTIETEPSMRESVPEKNIKTEPKKAEEIKEKTPVTEKIPRKLKEEQQPNGAFFYSFSDSLADTTNLVQIYKESTLNVSVKYPAGWTYIDQNVKSNWME